MRVMGDCCRARRGLQPSDDGLGLSVEGCACRLLECLSKPTLTVLPTASLDCSVLFSSEGFLTSSVYLDSEEVSVCLMIVLSPSLTARV